MPHGGAVPRRARFAAAAPKRPAQEGRQVAAHLVLSRLALAALLACGFAAPAARAQTDALDVVRAARTEAALTSTDALVAVSAFHRALSLHDDTPDPDAARTFAERARRTARQPLVRAHAAHALGLARAGAGDLDAARRLFDEVGLLDSALVIGPFDNTGGAAFGQDTPAEDVAATVGARVPGLDREVGWQRIERDPQGILDVQAAVQPLAEARVLVAFAVRVPAPRRVALRAGVSGQLRVLLNGVEVRSDDAERPLALDQVSVALDLLSGENLVVLELGNVTDTLQALVRFTDLEGRTLKLATDASADALKRASKTKPAPARDKDAAVVDPVAAAALAPALTAAGLAAIELERALRATDRRVRPPVLEARIDARLKALSTEQDLGPSAAERSHLWVMLGQERLDRDATGARRAFEAALALDAQSPLARAGLARLRADQGRMEEAERLYDEAVALAPRHDALHAERLRTLRGGSAWGGVVDAAIVARAAAVPTARNVSMAASVYSERMDPEAALQLHKKAKNAVAVAYAEEGLARARIAPIEDKDADRAIAQALIDSAQRLLSLRPADHAVATRLALLLLATDRRAELTRLVDDRARRYPERSEPLELRARVALAGGDRDAAKRAFDEALALRPQDDELQKTRRALGGSDNELVARYGIDLDDVLDDMKNGAPKDAVALGAHVAASTVAVRFYENGLAEIVEDKVVRIHDAKRAQGFQRLSFGYTQGRERMEVLTAVRVSAGGRREAGRVGQREPDGKQGGVYTDSATLFVRFASLEDGDALHVRVRKQLVGQQNLFGDFFGHVETVQSGVPVRRWRVVVEAPKARPLSWGGRGVPAPRVSDGASVRVYDFRVDEAAPLRPEPVMPPWMEVADYLSVSTYARWEDMGAWYEDLVRPQLLLDDELKAIAKDARARGQTDEAIARILYEYVVTATRYVGIELGIHGWKPYPVTEVHRRRFGDCKDKASLLVALLREAGVPANLALVRTANVGRLEQDPPSMWAFNHAIAYVPGLDLFLDGTAEQSGFLELPTMDQGAQTLIVGAHGPHKQSRLSTIPVAPADANLNVSRYTLTLQPDGALLVDGEERFRGHNNANERRALFDPATRVRTIERQLASIAPGARVTGVQVSDLGLAAEEIVYRFQAVLPARAVVDERGGLTMPVSLYPHDLSGNYGDLSKRAFPLWIDHPWRTQNVMRYVLPAGMKVAELPKGGRVQGQHVDFEQRITRTDDGFIVDENTALLSREVAPGSYARFRQDALAADALMKRKVRIEKSGAGS